MSYYKDKPRFYIKRKDGVTLKELPNNLRVNQFGEVEELAFVDNHGKAKWFVNSNYIYVTIEWD